MELMSYRLTRAVVAIGLLAGPASIGLTQDQNLNPHPGDSPLLPPKDRGLSVSLCSDPLDCSKNFLRASAARAAASASSELGRAVAEIGFLLLRSAFSVGVFRTPAIGFSALTGAGSSWANPPEASTLRRTTIKKQEQGRTTATLLPDGPIEKTSSDRAWIWDANTIVRPRRYHP
jgi:hypothetical protein